MVAPDKGYVTLTEFKNCDKCGRQMVTVDRSDGTTEYWPNCECK